MKKEEIDDYYKKWFEIFLQPTSNVKLSPEIRKLYFNKFTLFIIPSISSNNPGFGNSFYLDNPHKEIETKEPLVEIIESDKIVSITSELPGFEEENIELEITQDTVIIKANNGKKNFYKRIKLPCDIDADSKIAIFHNGILDAELKKIN